MDAQCRLCEEKTKVRFKEKQHPRGVKETYFRCEHCNERYSCFVTDGKVRKLQKEIDRIRRDKLSAENIRKLDEKQAKVNRLMADLKYNLERERGRM